LLLLAGKAFESIVMALSLLIVCGSYLLIVWKDRSWINWATPVFFFMLGGRYIFQFSYLCLLAPGGSHYAYFICYTAYAFPFLLGALIYAFVKPITIKTHSSGAVEDVGQMPWLLLFLGFLFYLPVLIEFRTYLTDPRRIYELTRSGYGIWTYGSTTFSNVALVVYLCGRRKSLSSAMFFYSALLLLTYWHGSKGLILNCVLVWALHRVYVERKRISAMAALSFALVAGTAVLGAFALFSNAADLADLAESVTSYADYVRNTMTIIDDEHGKRYYGRLTLENELYSRVPRAIMPNKPKDFGAFALAKIYNPASYRADAGTSAVDLGLDYADFGPFMIVVRCLYSASMAIMMSMTAFRLRRRGSPGTFMVFLLLSGISVVPVAGGFYLPETIILAIITKWLLQFRFIRAGTLAQILRLGRQQPYLLEQ
jgi:hypothetical protein